MNKQFLNKILVVILLLGLIYSPVSYAKGVVRAIAPVLAIIAVVVVAVVAIVVTAGAGVALAGVLGASLGTLGGAAVGGAIVGGAIVAGGLAGLVTADCLPGSPIKPGIFCTGGEIEAGESGGDGSGGIFTDNPASKVLSTTASPTCTSLTLNGINSQGHNYAIVRGGNVIAELPASQTSFADSGLVPHTNYQYYIRIPYPAESGFATSDSGPINGYTKCLPQCSFGVDNLNVVEFGSTDLRWKCLNNDPVVDSGSCKIIDSNNEPPKKVSALSGELSAFPGETTTYTLTCVNIDGTISIPQTVNILKSNLKEIKP